MSKFKEIQTWSISVVNVHTILDVSVSTCHILLLGHARVYIYIYIFLYTDKCTNASLNVFLHRPFETPRYVSASFQRRFPCSSECDEAHGEVAWSTDSRTFSKGHNPNFATTLKVHGCRLFKNALNVEGSCFHKKAYVKTIKDGLPFSHQIH